MLEVKQLSVVGKGGVPLLHNIDFSMGAGDRIGLTGMSGAGKTTLIKSIMGVLDRTSRVSAGDILLDNISIPRLPSSKRRNLCGTILGFIPQNPMTAFDRHHRIGSQMVETFRLRLGLSKKEAIHLAKETLSRVNLTDTERVLSAWPSQLSGGMLQRVTMAILWGLRPKYVLADEPTSALDEANRDLLVALMESYPEDAGIIFLSHDAVAIRRLCPRIMVLEQGRLVANMDTEMFFAQPTTPWAKMFVNASCVSEGGDWEWTAL